MVIKRWTRVNIMKKTTSFNITIPIEYVKLLEHKIKAKGEFTSRSGYIRDLIVADVKGEREQ